MDGRIFGLDLQLVFDLLFQAVCVLILFAFLSYLLFNPVKKILNDRKERVLQEIMSAKEEKQRGDQYRREYEEKLSHVEKEADEILNLARKQARKREEDILIEAKNEAAAIIKRADTQIDLEIKSKKEEIKQNMIEIAVAMAGKITAISMDQKKQEAFLENTLEEMGEETWRS